MIGGAISSRKKETPMLMLPSVRAIFIFSVLGLLYALLVGKAFYLQWGDSDFLQSQGAARYVRDIEIPGYRGRIVDRMGEPLAISTPVKSLWAFTGKLEIDERQLKDLAELLNMSSSVLRDKINAAGDFVYLAQGISPEIAEKVLALRIPGLYDENIYRRFYPAGELTSQIIGFTDGKDQGQEGIELARQNLLSGKSGIRRVIINRKGQAVEDIAAVVAPQQGRDLTLALDLRLQYLSQTELKAAVIKHKAKMGSVVVLDAQTGEILALANYPTYNPNNRSQITPSRMKSRALVDTFEPGSTLKPFTAAIALNHGKVKPNTVMNVIGGKMTIGNWTIHDAHQESNNLTVEQVVQRSSNVGTARMALMLTPGQMWQGLSAAGFGVPVGTGFPAEASGRLKPAKAWKTVEQATISYGHGVSVTLLQLAQAYTIFTTDGELKPASLYKSEGIIYGKPVIAPETAKMMRGILEKSVQPGGTGFLARVPDYRVAGKTGTARKPEKGGYSRKYVSSFVGFAPVTSPRLIVAVMIDEPSAGKYYGSHVAAPVFANITGKALRMLGMPSDRNIEQEIFPVDSEEIVEET
ncbi:MAG: penicillin-binding protein 2 [Burkholderiales bacterium]|jgi:cell division protein FtsI (penicillin-binding protein 3)|nr:penicillin-binding protein 2 [Burkholderiales bacterium]